MSVQSRRSGPPWGSELSGRVAGCRGRSIPLPDDVDVAVGCEHRAGRRRQPCDARARAWCGHGRRHPAQRNGAAEPHRTRTRRRGRDGRRGHRSCLCGGHLINRRLVRHRGLNQFASPSPRNEGAARFKPRLILVGLTGRPVGPFAHGHGATPRSFD